MIHTDYYCLFSIVGNVIVIVGRLQVIITVLSSSITISRTVDVVAMTAVMYNVIIKYNMPRYAYLLIIIIVTIRDCTTRLLHRIFHDPITLLYVITITTMSPIIMIIIINMTIMM